MRSKLRIPIFLNLIDGIYTDVFTQSFGFNYDDETIDQYVDSIYENLFEITEYWTENPDLRFSQVLINIGIIPNVPGVWYYKEEHEILQDLGVQTREFLLWGQNFDKDMNRLPETIYKPVKDLSTDHIKAILDGGWCRSEPYLQCFKDELILREGNEVPENI